MRWKKDRIWKRAKIFFVSVMKEIFCLFVAKLNLQLGLGEVL